MDRTRVPLGCFDQEIQVTGTIVIVEKNSATVIATLNHMQRIAGNEDAATAGHAQWCQTPIKCRYAEMCRDVREIGV
jgi:hypothetical protein